MSNDELLAPTKKGLLFVLSAPAGTGKTTLIEMLRKEFTEVIQSISYTSRSPRVGEINDVHYHFINEQQFEEKIQAGEFLEHVKLYGNYYGTSLKWVEEKLNAGKHVFLVIDTQGAALIKTKVKMISIFVKPPSLDELKNRLERRDTETQENIHTRLECAQEELEAAKNYDYIIVNDQLSRAYQILRSILIAESHRQIPSLI